MIGNILDNTTELYMIKYTFVEIFSSGRATLYKNPSDQTMVDWLWVSKMKLVFRYHLYIFALKYSVKEWLYSTTTYRRLSQNWQKFTWRRSFLSEKQE